VIKRHFLKTAYQFHNILVHCAATVMLQLPNFEKEPPIYNHKNKTKYFNEIKLSIPLGWGDVDWIGLAQDRNRWSNNWWPLEQCSAPWS
jgi:hypothetical protein